MNRYFGEPWDAPFLDHALRLPAPVGEVCMICEEPVTEDDQGIAMPHVYRDTDGLPAQRYRAQHRECMMFGILGHLAGQCFCHRGKGTVRERGRATIAWAEARQT